MDHFLAGLLELFEMFGYDLDEDKFKEYMEDSDFVLISKGEYEEIFHGD